MGSPRQRGLKASGLQRRQSGSETPNIKPISELPTLASFFLVRMYCVTKSTRYNQEAQIAETHQFQRRRQNKNEIPVCGALASINCTKNDT